MSADAPIVSRPYHAKMCCERCVFGRGEHDLWCAQFNIERLVAAFEGKQTLCSLHPEPRTIPKWLMNQSERGKLIEE